jgi:hypothetical protein
MNWLRAWWRKWFAAPDPFDAPEGTMPIPTGFHVPGEDTQAMYNAATVELRLDTPPLP